MAVVGTSVADCSLPRAWKACWQHQERGRWGVDSVDIVAQRQVIRLAVVCDGGPPTRRAL